MSEVIASRTEMLPDGVPERIGLVGLGSMGRGLAKSLLRGGFAVVAYDTAPEAGPDLEALGLVRGSSLPDVAIAGIIITCLPDPEAIRAVYLAADGLLASARAGTVIVDCSTSDPNLTRSLCEQAATRGIVVIDAPMLMGPREAAEGTLTLIVGGPADLVAALHPLFDAISARVIPAGPIGSAHLLKLINNAVVLGTHAVLCEAFTMATTEHIDLQIVWDVLSQSRAASRKLDELAPRLINDDHSLHFSLAVATKDLGLFDAMAKSVGTPHGVTAAAHDAFCRAMVLGFGTQNVSRVATAMAFDAGSSGQQEDRSPC
uniref:NAD(P)-dependent oxidoreductase n=1 Tax=Pararhizobium sp. IMCC3301 TaxID=3067904 RepID=UPI002741FD42|nr:NAD(P)-dependent oxidoreductase [Pararhizobium sp. IMCC3301]